MSKKQVAITTVIIESQKKNQDISANLYRYIQEELKKTMYTNCFPIKNKNRKFVRTKTCPKQLKR